MATSETQIANLALAHVGNGNQIASLTERSNEARACSLFYEQCRDEVLAAFPWQFATVIETLQLVQEDPTDEWGFSYRYPGDALTIWRLPSGCDRVAERADGTVVSLPPTIGFRIVQDSSGKVIYTDLEDATVEYAKRETDVTRFSADFTNALALRLASDIAPLVTGGDPFGLGVKALQKYQMALDTARTRAANEEGQDPPPDSTLVTSRY